VAVGRLLAACARRVERVNLILGLVFLLVAVFYVWTAASSEGLSLHDPSGDRYNLLASALLHFHLSIGPAPADLTRLADPYKPALNRTLIGSINDDVLYHGQLYFIWGPAPALVLLVPLHLLGFEPSASFTVSAYAIAGLGFVLATLRVIIRRIGDMPLWMCAIAGLALSLCSAIPFVLRTPGVSEDVLAGGYCFTMAGVWLATAALASRGASVTRLVLMSLCFGLAAGSRPALALGALVLIPVYLGLRPSRPRRSLALALGLPVAVCLALLLAYNQARFNQPFEIGSHYQLSGYDSQDAPLGRLSYALPGAWLYAITPPQLMVVFPFIAVSPPTVAYPTAIAPPEITGGLLPMTPIVVFVLALPWIWRRRPALLGALAVPLMVLAGVGVALMLVAAYEFFASTERYEVDFATLLVLGGLSAWLALSKGPPSARRRLLRVGGAVLVAWGCATGFATSFFGNGNLLSAEHPSTWRTLEDIGSPLSTAVAVVAGHPLLAATFGSVSSRTGDIEYVLDPGEQGDATIVSPGTRTATLKVKVELLPGTRYRLGIEGPGHAGSSYPVPAGGGTVELPVQLGSGLNHLALYPLATSSAEAAVARPVMRVSHLSLASGV
jgi:hypothetical protein